MRVFLISILLIYMFLNGILADDIEICTQDEKFGICKPINKCPSALDGVRLKKYPKICSFVDKVPLVCCFDEVIEPKLSNSNRTSTLPRFTEIDDSPKIDENKNETVIETSQCEPVPSKYTVPKTGQKAFDKCVEYQEKYVFPCRKNTTGFNREIVCATRKVYLPLGKGGRDAVVYEFPHMSLLGYGTNATTANWLCGGSVISEKFILTAAHCTNSSLYGAVTFARVGILNQSEPIVGKTLYAIKNIVKHNKFNPPQKYHDIALLETDREMALSPYLVPACLHVIEQDIDDSLASATGWGELSYKGLTPDILQQVKLTKFDNDICDKKFPIHRHLLQGYDRTTQMCYGDHKTGQDTCQGDSGGPLQVFHPQLFCMYTVIGVTSFGHPCGVVGEPAVYTKVDAYRRWIESVVWK